MPPVSARAMLLAVAAPMAAGYSCTPGDETHMHSSRARLTMTTVCLSGAIEGPLENDNKYKMLRQNFFRGPSPMHSVADPGNANVIYFSWTEDRPWGLTSNDGLIHVTKVELSQDLPPYAKVAGQVNYPGFVRASQLDVTPEGKIGVLCAKMMPEWSKAWVKVLKDRHPQDAAKINDEMSGLLLAVCEADSKTMRATGKPWRIGTPYGTSGARREEIHAGTYPKISWYEMRDNGYGWLTYASHLKTWTTWYGASAGWHTGFSMHTYEDGGSVDPGPWQFGQAGIEYRKEEWPGVQGRRYHDHNRHGTGDHQMGSMTRYNPMLKDIAIVKHHHIPLYMQQYGLEAPQGRFDPGPTGSGHKHGRVELSCPLKGDVGRAEGAIRPCGRGWIMGIVTDKGNVCARINQYGKFVAWNVIESALWHKASDQNLNQYWRNKMVRIAPLGSPESDARCGADARFLMGYWTNSGPDHLTPPRRWLVEINGNCEKVTTPWEVTDITTWPKHQEWTTTKSGAVTWVTSWGKTPNGKPVWNMWGTKRKTGSTDGLVHFNTTNYWEEAGIDRGVQNEAHIMVYYPSSPPRMPSRPGAFMEEGEQDFSTDVCNTTSPFGDRAGEGAAIKDATARATAFVVALPLLLVVARALQ